MRLTKSIIITKSQRQSLVEHAKKNAPNESCALLFGRENENSYTVEEIFFATNKDRSPINFTISNEELILGYQEAERKKLDVVGIFHSHPHSEPVPSATDRKFMQVNPVVWVIFSNKSDSFAAYLLESEVEPIAVKII
ncbi:MAG: M67 family metallopeptidase [Candidatus Nitrosotenuis sp.]